jgi:glycosyltransferase involved in cell wall biosynthesis
MFVPNYPYPVVGGLERQAHELSKTLIEHFNLQVFVVSGKIYPRQPNEEIVEGVNVTRYGWRSSKLAKYLFQPFELVSLLWRLREQFDVFHAHQHSLVSIFAVQFVRLIGKKTVVKLPNVGDYGIPGLRAEAFGRLRCRLLMRSDCLVAMSKESIAELLTVGYPESRILKVPNGISKQPKSSISNACEESYNSQCRVVFVGRITSQKGIDVLLRAWVIVQKSLPGQARLELWGTGSDGDKLLQLVSDLGIESSVLFRGHVTEVRSDLREAHIFVLPSAYEGNSNAVLEAMEAGLPVVATALGGTSMQVGPEGSGLLFPVGDSLRLAEQLIILIKDPAARKRYGEKMVERIDQYFDIRRVAGFYKRAYQLLVSQSPEDIKSCSNLPDN